MPWKSQTHKPVAWRPPGAERPKRADPFYLGDEWKAKRSQVLLRDHHTCQIQLAGCYGYANTADHIVPRSEGGSNDMENLRAACHSCHNRRHVEKGNKPAYLR